MSKGSPFDVSILEKKFELDIGGGVIFNALLHGGKELRDLRRLLKSVRDFDELYLKVLETAKESAPTP